MQVDFYQLSRGPVEKVVAGIARKVVAGDGRLLVVSGDEAQRQAISQALWSVGGGEFLANGTSDAPHADRQQILISVTAHAANGATLAIIADGVWREEASTFERVLMMFGESETEAARTLWRTFDAREDVDRRIFKQTPEGSWREGA